MSSKASKAVDDALAMAAELESEGRRRDAEIVRRLCRSNVGYRNTLNQLWTDNMGLRWAHAELWKENCLLTGRVIPERAPTPTPSNPFAEDKAENTSEEDFADPSEVRMVWCAQCDRRVTVARASACASPFCKAKAQAGDRLKQLGNAVVPQIPELIGRAILAAEAA